VVEVGRISYQPLSLPNSKVDELSPYKQGCCLVWMGICTAAFGDTAQGAAKVATKWMS
jgi:hypothetical protein